MNTITKGSYVQFHFDLYTEDGSLVASSRDSGPYAYVHGIMETEPPALGERLIGRSTGFQGDIILPPEEAYGKRPSDEESIKIIPVEELNKDFPTEMTVEKGVMFHSEFKMPNGKQGQVLCTIVDIKDDQAILYLGNPLAGQTVRFAVEVLEVRDATEEDIRQLAERYAQPS